jgi:ArsR family transcriptional regulator
VLAPGGRLVVVDLAQHDLEWLRTEKGHRRLGFAQSEVAGWFAELGLEPAPVTRLQGEGADVCLWLAQKVVRDADRRDVALIDTRTERAA